MTAIAETFSSSQITTAQAQAIAGSAKSVANGKQFVFFAAFDATKEGRSEGPASYVVGYAR